MLTIRPQQNIVEKILTTRAGKQVRVKFLVVETAGNIQFKVLSITPIAALTHVAKVLALPGKVAAQAVYEVESFLKAHISPYFSLFFFNSQPTRGPDIY